MTAASRPTGSRNLRREQILSAIPEGGITVAAIAKAFGMKHTSAEAKLRLYAKAGHVFMARISREPKKPAEGWYFRSQAARDAAQAAHTKKDAPAPKRWVPVSKLPRRIEATNPNNVQPIELPSTLRSRFTPEEVPPCFSSLKPGQYLADAPAWIQAATKRSQP